MKTAYGSFCFVVKSRAIKQVEEVESMDITSPVIREYIEATMPERDEKLQHLWNRATKENVPIIKHEMENLLTFLVRLYRPDQILEIGTAVGYSAIIMDRAAGKKALITTLEISDRMIEKAKNNFREFQLEERIQLIHGDATETLKDLKGPYDMIFMDAAKGQYQVFFEEAVRLLKVGGLLIIDNVLQDGYIAKSRYAIPRRQRTIHSRMRDLLRQVSQSDQWTTTIMPIADGTVLAIKEY